MSLSSALGFAVGPALWIAAVLALIPLLAAAFFSPVLARWVERMPLPLRLVCPAVLCIPYVLVATSFHVFRWGWVALYALLPVVIAVLLWQAKQADRSNIGDWRDALVLV